MHANFVAKFQFDLDTISYMVNAKKELQCLQGFMTSYTSYKCEHLSFSNPTSLFNVHAYQVLFQLDRGEDDGT